VDLEIQGHTMPVARKRSEMEAIMKGASARRDEKPMRIVLCASPKDPGHGGAGFHDYPLWRERWAKLLGLADGVVVETADRWPGAEQWDRSDLIVFYHDNPAWSAEKAADLDEFLERGGGLVFLHWSLNAYRDVEPLAKRLGWAWGPGAKFRHGVEGLALTANELTADFPRSTTFTDESYWNLTGDGSKNNVIATSMEDGEARPQIWLNEKGEGRVLVCIPGHFTWTFDDPLYRLLLLRGMSWSCRQPLNRLDELAFIGARWSD
jgi:type 1 glutamine amidotransferase